MQSTIETLLERLKRGGDAADWEQFYQIYSGVIVRYAQKLGLGQDAAFDVLQETMITLMRLLPEFTYDKRKGKFRNFVFTIVHRKTLAAIRRAARRGEVSMDQSDDSGGRRLLDILPDPAGEAEAAHHEVAWRESVMEEALANLRKDPSVQPRTLEVFEAYAIRGEGPAEVAKRFGLKENAVYQIKNRLIQRLRDEVRALLEEDEEATAAKESV
jgi:RNA polymerase sigma-70 factor (ECF subfamily)